MAEQLCKCPHCKSEEIESDGYEPNEGVMIREMFCMKCGYKWNEIYEFNHNENLDGTFLKGN